MSVAGWGHYQPQHETERTDMSKTKAPAKAPMKKPGKTGKKPGC